MRAAVAALALAAAGCSQKPDARFEKMAEEFVYTTLAFSPVSATSTGLHEYQGKKLDEMLDDYSDAGIERQKRFYSDFGGRLGEIRREELSAQDRADYDIIRDQIALARLELDEIQSYRHNPTVYVELAGNALFSPSVLNYAPKEQRAKQIIARLRALPALLVQARLNLVSAPEIWTRVAREENAGNINLVDKSLRSWMPAGEARAYGEAAGPALDALRRFDGFLRDNLAQRQDWDWRLGRERYGKKFRYVLSSGTTPEKVLQDAGAELDAVRARMTTAALALNGGGKAPAAGDTAGQNRLISAALDRIAARHSTRESYVQDARDDLEEARRFVREKNIVTLPPRSNLQVIETPEFMRGIYAVGGFNPAPALEPQLGAFYWITPIPADWPAARAESKLREYNFYKLKLLTIHEAMPGHYVQFEYADEVQPRTRRLLRSVFGNGPYIEGWAQYATETMLQQGFLGDPPEMRLTFDKERLRVLANAILDIRLHTMNMTDQEALDLMQNRAFQEAEEARAKLQRAKLSSCQLPTYWVGWQGWDSLRDRSRQAQGSGFRPVEFNDRALRQGAVPLPVLERLMAGR